MSATQAVEEYMKTFKPDPKETVRHYAKRMYNMQMEIYDAYAMGGINNIEFEHIPAKDREAWYRTARKRAAEFGMTLIEN